MPRPSVLAKQLQALAQEDRLVRGVLAGGTERPSFLFHPKEAADYDDDSIYTLGLEGMQELCKQDSSLSEYQSHIFASSLVETDPSRWNRKERAVQYEPLRAFLLLLAPHFMKQECHKVLEWMVRKWRVNETMVDDLMVAILPYHDSVAFVRMVQIIYFTSGCTWAFLLDKVKRDGSPVNRTLLAQRCTVEPGILNLVCRAITFYQRHGTLHPQYTQGTTFITFATFLMLETLAAYKKFPDTEAIKFYQRIEQLLQHGTNTEAITGAMMIFLSLAERAELSEDACHLFIKRIISVADEGIHRHVLLTMARMVEGGHVETLPEEAVAFAASRLSEIREMGSQFAMDRFLSCLTTACSRSARADLRQLGSGLSEMVA